MAKGYRLTIRQVQWRLSYLCNFFGASLLLWKGRCICHLFCYRLPSLSLKAGQTPICNYPYKSNSAITKCKGSHYFWNIQAVRGLYNYEKTKNFVKLKLRNEAKHEMKFAACHTKRCIFAWSLSQASATLTDGMTGWRKYRLHAGNWKLFLPEYRRLHQVWYAA